MVGPADYAELLEAARAAAKSAYCPYSLFPVGAAVLANGRIIQGVNVENASYGLTMCAERSAIFAAVAAGARSVDAVAVSCLAPADGAPDEALMPCGACRQVMAEFGSANMPVIVDRVRVFRLEELLPLPFSLVERKMEV